MQILCSNVLGTFITYTGRDYLLAWLPLPTSYIMKLIYLLISIIIIAIGVSFYLIPDIVPLPPEGLMGAIVKISNDRFKFSNVKVAVDCSLVLISAILSLIFLGGLRSVKRRYNFGSPIGGKGCRLYIQTFQRSLLLIGFEKEEAVSVNE